MAVDYPSNLRPAQYGMTKEQFRTIRESQPLSGPAYTQKLSTDAPVLYDLEFKFWELNEAIQFRAWVEVNDIHRGVQFNCPIRTEAFRTEASEVQQTQLVKLVNGDIRSYSRSQSEGYFVFTGQFLCRKEVTGLEDYYDIIAPGGGDLLDGREILDVAINQDAPEYP